MFERFIEQVRGPTGLLLVIDDGTSVVQNRLDGLARVAVRWSVPHGSPPEARKAWGGVVLLVSDRQSLRAVVSVLPALGTSERVWCWVEDCGGKAPAPLLRPEWPRLVAMSVETRVSGTAAMEFAAPAPVREVLLGVARGALGQCSAFPGQPMLGGARTEIGRWLPGSPDSFAADDVTDLFGPDAPFPPDAVIVEDPAGMRPGTATPPHPATGRPVPRITLGPELDWDDLAPRAPLSRGSVVRQLHDLSVAPVDEQVINPTGFERDWSGGLVAVQASLRSTHEIMLEFPDGKRRVVRRVGLKDSDVTALRPYQGVTLDWSGGGGPQAYVRLVAGLAMAGVPLATTTVPRWARSLLDSDLVRELEAGANLGDRLMREERSVRLRRAGLAAHSSHGWRRRLARANGLPEPRSPSVSVLLATRRPEMVSFALRQIAKQRGVEGEVVLATHGFEADAATQVALADTSWNLHVLCEPADTPFGEVLNRAAARASGDVLIKMDDDDWYGPHFIADLLLARIYSGADVVGMPAEFFFLEQLWRTVRRPDATERFTPIVAGATLTIGRGTLGDVGGFRPLRRAVDAALLAAVREGGGSIYRAQGLGFMVRRGTTGHTWDPGLGYFLTRSRVAAQWHGFRPTGQLAVPDEDRPIRTAPARQHSTEAFA